MVVRDVTINEGTRPPRVFGNIPRSTKPWGKENRGGGVETCYIIQRGGGFHRPAGTARWIAGRGGAEKRRTSGRSMVRNSTHCKRSRGKRGEKGTREKAPRSLPLVQKGKGYIRMRGKKELETKNVKKTGSDHGRSSGVQRAGLASLMTPQDLNLPA